MSIKVSERMRNVSQKQKDVVFGFIKNYQSQKKIIPLEIVYIICILYDLRPDLIISQNDLYIMNGTNYYSLIHIKENGLLTVDCWSGIYNENGGILVIFCDNIILEKGATIDLNSQGYKGGQSGGYSGHSYTGTSKETTEANFGGGGGGYYGGAGGGGYGSRGKDGRNNEKSGGSMYGDKELSLLHLGSGGGCGYSGCGGSGGGALKIQCLSNIILKEDATISCDGGDGRRGSGSCCGGGSGGSIHIIVDNIRMSESSSITAKGGESISGYGDGDGGDGRIRIEYKSKNNDSIYDKKWNINPQPFVE